MELLNTLTAAKMLNVSGAVLKKWHDTGDYPAHHMSPGGLRLYDANLMKGAAQISSCFEIKTRSKSEVLSVLKRTKCVALFGSLIGVHPNIEEQRNIILGHCLEHNYLPSFDFETFPQNPRDILRRMGELNTKTLITSPICFYSRDQLLTLLSIAHKYGLNLISVNDKRESKKFFGMDFAEVEVIANSK